MIVCQLWIIITESATFHCIAIRRSLNALVATIKIYIWRCRSWSLFENTVNSCTTRWKVTRYAPTCLAVIIIIVGVASTGMNDGSWPIFLGFPSSHHDNWLGNKSIQVRWSWSSYIYILSINLGADIESDWSQFAIEFCLILRYWLWPFGGHVPPSCSEPMNLWSGANVWSECQNARYLFIEGI